MKTLRLLSIIFISLISINKTYSQLPVVLYVSNNGNDANSGYNGYPVKTLKGAYDKITNAGNTTYTIILKDDGGNINVGPIGGSYENGFDWTKSGTASHPITVKSDSCYSTITRVTDVGVMLNIKDANYINFYYVHFLKGVSSTFILDNADYCKIDYCKFSGESSVDPTDGGIIWVGNNRSGTSTSYSNVISNNKFYNILTNHKWELREGVLRDVKEFHHAIYVSVYAHNNSIYNNTIKDPSSYAIHYYHDNYRNNVASNNILTQNTGNGFGSKAMVIGYQSGEDPLTITNNKLTSNFVHDASNTLAVNISGGLPANNDPHTLVEQPLNTVYSNLYPNDPYWLGYSHSQITDKMVTGDFDRDGKLDDVAAFYDNGNGTTNIHVWETDGVSKKAFEYSGSTGWWYGSSYSANKITGKVVSGDFDRDGYIDDIAAFYDYGNNVTRIHVWKSNGSSFVSSGSWWYTSGYNSNMIINRVVSGDFDRDGKHDDIAAFYDNGSGNTNLHVWKSTGSSFQYQYSAGWWGVSNGGYDVNKITGRVVSGDFDRDGTYDDIAAFYDNGSGNTNLHIWLSTGTSFSYQNSNGWWGISNGGYDVNKITGRVVSGDFDRDGKHDDIAAFYDNGSSSTNLHMWLSTGSSMTYQNSNGWWASTGYDVNKITGHVVSGDFDRDGYSDDISGFYDYSSTCGNLRSNVWQSSGLAFSYVNASLGYPWLTTSSYARLSSTFPEENESIENESLYTDKFILFPNPSNREVNIRFSLSQEQNVECSIYTLTGKKVVTLLNSVNGSGGYSLIWNGDDAEGNKVIPGIYLCTLTTNEKVETQKLIITE